MLASSAPGTRSTTSSERDCSLEFLRWRLGSHRVADRVVRFHPTFFDDLDELLPSERSANGLPSTTDFLLYDLPAFAICSPTTTSPTRWRSTGGRTYGSSCKAGRSYGP